MTLHSLVIAFYSILINYLTKKFRRSNTKFELVI